MELDGDGNRHEGQLDPEVEGQEDTGRGCPIWYRYTRVRGTLGQTLVDLIGKVRRRIVQMQMEGHQWVLVVNPPWVRDAMGRFRQWDFHRAGQVPVIWFVLNPRLCSECCFCGDLDDRGDPVCLAWCRENGGTLGPTLKGPPPYELMRPYCLQLAERVRGAMEREVDGMPLVIMPVLSGCAIVMEDTGDEYRITVLGERNNV